MTDKTPNGAALTIDMARRMAAPIPDAEAAIIPNLKHMALAEDPAAVIAPLVSFLDRTAA